MAKRAPIYEEHGKAYQADTCTPLSRAVEVGEIRLEALVRGRYIGSKSLARGTLPGICTLGFWDVKKDLDWGFDWQRNEGIELTFLESGTVSFDIGSHSYELQPNHLTITRPWQRHRVAGPLVTAQRLHFLVLDVGVHRPHQAWKWPSWLMLTDADRKQLTNVLRHNEQSVWHTTDEMRHCFQRIGRAVETDQSGSNISWLVVHLNKLFLLVLEMYRHGRVQLDESLSSTRRTVELFWADVKENHDSLAREWTLRRMAKECGLGVTRFVHYSKQLTNMTPVEHLNHCRLEAASKLLVQQPEMSVADVARSCGFSSARYFATVFRQHFGRSPAAFRADPSS